MDAVKADWSEELAGLQDRPEGLTYALRYLPADRPPTVQQFKAICDRAPTYAPPALPAPPASPQAVEQVRSMVGAICQPTDRLSWARALKDRHDRGEKLTLAQRDAYKGALANELP